MKPIDYIIIGLAIATVAGVIAWRIIRRKQGKTACDCCSSCSGCNGCGCSEKTEK